MRPYQPRLSVTARRALARRAYYANVTPLEIGLCFALAATLLLALCLYPIAF